MFEEKRILTIGSEDLRQLCIRHQWFTDGSNSQYEKLFYALSMKAPFEEIVTIIWVCSDADKWCRRDIIDILMPYSTVMEVET